MQALEESVFPGQVLVSAAQLNRLFERDVRAQATMSDTPPEEAYEIAIREVKDTLQDLEKFCKKTHIPAKQLRISPRYDDCSEETAGYIIGIRDDHTKLIRAAILKDYVDQIFGVSVCNEISASPDETYYIEISGSKEDQEKAISQFCRETTISSEKLKVHNLTSTASRITITVEQAPLFFDALRKNDLTERDQLHSIFQTTLAFFSDPSRSAETTSTPAEDFTSRMILKLGVD